MNRDTISGRTRRCSSWPFVGFVSSCWKPCAIAAVMVLAFLTATPARAIDQAMPGAAAAADPHADVAGPDEALHEQLAKEYASQDRRAFEAGLNMAKLRLLAVQHLDQVKILDSWARQSIRTMRHRQTIDDHDPVYAALDMAFRPEAWVDARIIYVESPPIREELARFTSDPVEAKRIHDEGLVSFAFLTQPEVEKKLDELGDNATYHDAAGKVFSAMQTFDGMASSLAMVPPPPSLSEMPWLHPNQVANDLIKNGAQSAAATQGADSQVLAALTLEQKKAVAVAYVTLQAAWQGNDLKATNKAIDDLALAVQPINPNIYPSHAKAVTEHLYNLTSSGTMLLATVYFAAMALFLMVTMGTVKRGGAVAKTAAWVFGLALATHLLAMGVRWWLNGRIPIQNEFESITGSACIGCCIGLALELWKRNGIFGTAFSFVGFLAATSLLAVPYVFGRDIGSSPAKVAGILDTYWLYIHVNIVIASYALIFASAIIGMIYLGMLLWHWINPIEPGFDPAHSAPTGAVPNGGGTAPVAATKPMLSAQAAAITAQRATTLMTLDQANVVVLQMVFWALGVGIMCGAVWADHSWGRPWGWDPKETFALVTWIVYLAIVHLRMVVKWKGGVTAWLSVLGCAVMLFNWIGVNFFLKGLHSYA